MVERYRGVGDLVSGTLVSFSGTAALLLHSTTVAAATYLAVNLRTGLLDNTYQLDLWLI
jgi:hypothetical protein